MEVSDRAMTHQGTVTRTEDPARPPGALDDLDRALTYQDEVIDRLTAKLVPVTDPHHFADLVKIADEPQRDRQQTKLRELITRVADLTARLERLHGDVDV